MSLGSKIVCGTAAVLLLALSVRAWDRSYEPVRSPEAFALPRSAEAFALREESAPGSRLPTPDTRQGSPYVGSEACARCHEDQQKLWMNSIHVKMTKPVGEALVAGDFSGRATLSAHGRSYGFGRRNGKPFVRIAFGPSTSSGPPRAESRGGDRAPETFQVDYTLGAKRFQGYLSTLGDGRIYVLPVFWHVESRRWVDWKEITPIPDGAHDLRQIWNVNCFNCHATNLVQGFDPATRRYQTRWTEMGIGCEACHGPGREHIQLAERWEKDPASKPVYDTSDSNRALSDTLKTFSTRSSEPRKVYDACGYCHGNKTNLFVGFEPGNRYEDYAVPFLLSEPIAPGDLQGEFWPDGRPSRFNRTQAVALSGCFKAGAIACTSCHLAHGATTNEFSLKVDIHDGRKGDELCTQCHQTPKGFESLPELQASFSGRGLIQHTFHLVDSEGSRCINCHMSDVNWRLLTRRRDHTFEAPVPELTARFGIPNACAACHDEKSPEWAAAKMDEWWGNGERRRTAVWLADAMYRAGAGDPGVLPDLARVAVDRSQGFVIRASAAEFIGRLASAGRSDASRAVQSQTAFVSSERTNEAGGVGSREPGVGRSTTLGTAPTDAPPVLPRQRLGERVLGTAALKPAIINAVIGAAADPEPTVRAAAVRALALVGDRARAITPLTARLVDPARVVRARAAEALLALGIVELPGAAGDALRQAQADYRLSLASFPDVATNHVAEGKLESDLGRSAEATRALDTAIRLDPKLTYAWVLKGIVSARQGRFEEALEFFRRAKAIEPGYPRIDELIEEAERRRR
jgi:predicted CXXCH cytochrome family protein